MSAAYRCGPLCNAPDKHERSSSIFGPPKLLAHAPVVESVNGIAENDKKDRLNAELQNLLGKVTEQQKALQADIEGLINRRNDAMDAKLDSIKDLFLKSTGIANGPPNAAFDGNGVQPNASSPSKGSSSSAFMNLVRNSASGGAPAIELASEGGTESQATRRSLKDAVEKVKQMNKVNDAIIMPRGRHHNVDLEDPSVIQQESDDALLVQDIMKQMGIVTEKQEENVGTLEGFKRFLRSTKFDLMVGFIIMINSIVMALNLEHEGLSVALVLGLEPDTDWWPMADKAFLMFEHIFSALFLLELILRLYSMRCKYFESKANWLDCGIVMTTVLDMYILSMLGINFPNVSVIRLLRIVKLVRVLRIIRVLRFFRQLRILIHSIISSVGALGWSMALLSIIQLIGAIIMSQTLQPWLKDETQDLDDRKYIYSYFGTFARAAITMFEITFAPGAWGGIGREIIYKVNRNYTVFFLLYVAGVTFAVIRVITAIFLKETLAAAESDREMKMAEKKRQRDAYIRSLQTLFSELDTDGGGHLSLHEVQAMLKDPRVEIWMSVLDLEVHEVEDLFSLLDTGDGEISFDEFMAGLIRLKGSAKSIDLVTLLYESKHTTDKVDKLLDITQTLATELDRLNKHQIKGLSGLMR